MSKPFVVIGGGLWQRGSRGWLWAKRNLVPKSQAKPKPVPFKPLEGCDYVSGPTPAQLKAAGKRFVCRYLSTPGNPKNITATEARSLHAAGIAVVLVFETTASRALGGAAVGRLDATSARSQARAVGCPDSVPLYFAVDFNATGAELGLVQDYIRGAVSVLGKARTGVYGGLNACQACSSICGWFWQTYAWSGGKWFAGNHIEQYENGVKLSGHSVDLDRAVKAAYGQWSP